MVSALDSGSSGLAGLEPWLGSLRCVPGQGIKLSQCLSPPRINGYQRQNAGGNLQWTRIPSRGSNTPTFVAGFMLQLHATETTVILFLI